MGWRTVVIGLLILASGSSAFGQTSPADQQFTFAVRLLREGQMDLAKEALSDFARDYPSDRRAGDAFYQLALIAHRSGDLKAAMNYLQQVHQPLYASAAAVALLRGQFLLEADQPQQALDALETIDAKTLDDDAKRSTWHYLRGLGLKRTGKLDAAADRLSSASELDTPLRPRAFIELARVQSALGRSEAAMKSIRQATDLAKEPIDAAEAAVLHADLAYRAGQFEAAIAGYDRIIESHATSDWFKPAIAGLLRSLYAAGLDQQLIERHDQLADRIAAADLGQSLYLRAAAHVRLKQYDKALSWLKQFNQRTDPGHAQRQAAIDLAGVCLYHTDVNAFEDWYTINQPDSRELLYLRALAAISRKQPDKAIEHLSVLIQTPGTSTHQALLQRAALYEQMGKAELASADYALCASKYAKADEAAALEGRAIELALNAGHHERVVALAGPWLSRNARSDAAPRVQLMLSLALLKQNKPAQSIAQLDQIIAAVTDESILTLAHFYRGLAQATQFDAKNPQHATSSIQSLNKAISGKLPDAQRAEAFSILAQLYRQTDQPDKALEAYQSLRSLSPDRAIDPNTALWVGRGLIDAHKAQQALPWLQRVIEQKPEDQATRSSAMYYHALAQAQLGDHAKAIEMYRRLLAYSQVFGDQGRLGLARSLQASGDRDGALEEYAGLINVRGSAVAASALYESAMLLLEQSRDHLAADQSKRAGELRTEARRRLNRLVILYDLRELDPLPAQAYLALGRLDALEGRSDLAATRYQKILDQAGQPAWHGLAAADLHWLAGRSDEAVRGWRDVVDNYPDSPAAKEASSALQQRTAQP